MTSLSNNSEILIQTVLIETEIITNRIFAIKNVFYQTSDVSLRKRLSNEYSFLFLKFEELKAKVSLFKTHDKNKFSYSSILHEKFNRSEKLIYQDSNLFFV